LPDNLISNEAFQTTNSAMRRPAPPKLPPLSWEPAEQAYVVMEDWSPPSKRLIFITRGRPSYQMLVDSDYIAECTVSELKELAEMLNLEMGVPTPAAKALSVDWNNHFSTPPLCPRMVAAFQQAEREIKAARKGDKLNKACSDAWLRLKLHLHYWQPKGPILKPADHHFAVLAAFYEKHDWAEVHGRSKASMAVSEAERAAFRFYAAAYRLRQLQGDYNHNYSREALETSRRMRDEQRIAEITSVDPVVRRTKLLELREKRRPALRAMFKARNAYRAARPAVFATRAAA
jgi:hypothetical protein